jgi:hypothetical protein
MLTTTPPVGGTASTTPSDDPFLGQIKGSCVRVVETQDKAMTGFSLPNMERSS